MNIPSDGKFSEFIAEALDQLPAKYTSRLQNVLITYEDEPSAEQRNKLQLACNQSLFGLYEGIPMTKRGNGFSGQLPDKITLFKMPLFYASSDETDFKKRIRHTLWHEIAHYFGLDHPQIHALEDGRALQE